MVKFLFSVHTIITEAKQSNMQGGARAVDLPVRSFDLARPGVAPPLKLKSSTVHYLLIGITVYAAHRFICCSLTRRTIIRI